jgi:hypothetical protein
LAFAVICLVVLAICCYFSTLLLGAWSVIFSAASLSGIAKLLTSLFADADHQKQHLVLHRDGKVDCRQGEYFTLSANSRIGWFGCWLFLTRQDDKHLLHNAKQQQVKQFIFRDSVAKHGYARLCRQILRARQLSAFSNNH